SSQSITIGIHLVPGTDVDARNKSGHDVPDAGVDARNKSGHDVPGTGVDARNKSGHDGDASYRLALRRRRAARAGRSALAHPRGIVGGVLLPAQRLARELDEMVGDEGDAERGV